MPTLPSACPLDCPDSCSLDVEVEEGRITRVDGSTVNPYTAGYVCGKVRRIARHVYGPERIRDPLLRMGAKGAGQFRPVSWEEALTRITGELRRMIDTRGGEAILPYSYGGSNGWLTQGGMDARLFRRLGASRLVYSFCALPSGAAHRGLYGRMPGVAFEDYVHAQMITVWGTNPSATGIHLVPILKEARARGAFLCVVDPREIPLAKQADLHLALRPGTDVVVALGFIHALFERGHADLEFLAAHASGVDELRARASEWPLARVAQVSGVPLARLEEFVERYAAASPAVVRCGYGLERNRNGGSGVAAVLALPAVAGKFGVRGGGFTMSQSGYWDSVNTRAAVGAAEPSTRVINMSQLGSALCELREPPVELLFVYNANPLATAPEQERVRAGLERQDLFTVVFEQVMTDTAMYADVVLPATTFLEHRELRGGYGATVLFDAKPVIQPVGQARSNHEVFGELCERMGVTDPADPRTTDDMVGAVLSSSPEGSTWTEQLATSGVARGAQIGPVQFVDIFPRTPDGKIHLVPGALDAQAPQKLYAFQADPATADHPLALITPASGKTISSTFGQLIDGIATVELSVDDAAARGIQHGDRVRVFNAGGSVECSARIDPSLRDGVVVMPKGMWRKHTYNGVTANALCPDTEADLGRGACYNDARVQVTRVELAADRAVMR